MVATGAIDLVVITPERQVLEAQTDSVVLPAHDGELGVLEQRAPLMCELGAGQLRYRQKGRMERVFVDGGFAQVHDDRVTVLTDFAVPAEEISDEMIADAERTAEDESGETPVEIRARARTRARALRAIKQHH